LLNNTTVHQAAASQKGPPLQLNTNFFHPNNNQQSLSSTEHLIATAQSMNIEKQISQPSRGKAVAATDLGIDMKSVLMAGKQNNRASFNATQGH